MATWFRKEVIGLCILVTLGTVGIVGLGFIIQDHYFAPYATLAFAAPRALSADERAAVLASLESRARPLDNLKKPLVQATSDRTFRLYIMGLGKIATNLQPWLGRRGIFEAVIQAADPTRAVRTVPSADGMIPLSSDVLLRNEHIQEAFLGRDKESGEHYIAIKLAHPYGDTFADLTALHTGKVLVTMMDEQVITRATLRERIGGGRLAIHGGWRDEAGRVAAGTIVNLLRSPPLPVTLTARYVGETPSY